MGRLETAGRNEFISSLTSLAEAHLRSMEDGVAMWKDVLANLEKIDEQDTINSTTPPTTPTPVLKSLNQLPPPALPPKPNTHTHPHPSTPKSSHTPSILSSFPSTPDTPPHITLDNSHINSFDSFDSPTSLVEPSLRRNSSPKPLLSELPTEPTTPPYQSNKDRENAKDVFENSSEGIGIPKSEQEEYEELAL